MNLDHPKLFLSSMFQKLGELFVARKKDLDSESMKLRFPPVRMNSMYFGI
jgi:hypothetical protein